MGGGGTFCACAVNKTPVQLHHTRHLSKTKYYFTGQVVLPKRANYGLRYSFITTVSNYHAGS